MKRFIVIDENGEPFQTDILMKSDLEAADEGVIIIVDTKVGKILDSITEDNENPVKEHEIKGRGDYSEMGSWGTWVDENEIKEHLVNNDDSLISLIDIDEEQLTIDKREDDGRSC